MPAKTKNKNEERFLIYQPSNLLNSNLNISEKIKSVDVAQDSTHLDKEQTKKLGEPHPFNYQLVEGVAKKFGLIPAVIDKITDFTFGPGMYISSDNLELVDALEDWILSSKINAHLKPWMREGLLKGTSYMEISGLDNLRKKPVVVNISSDTIFIKKDKHGIITGYNQFLGNNLNKLTKENINFLNKDRIIQFDSNKIGKSKYGMGLVFPALPVIDNYLSASTSIHKLMKRKANSPLHVKIGDIEKELYPEQSDIDDIGKKLQFMNECTEFATGPDVEMKVIDFGDIGSKFKDIFDLDMKMLSYVFQVPEVILGSDRGFSGSAEVQDEGFDMNIKSYQEQIGFILKNKIFDIIAELLGFKDVEYEVIWGQQSEKEKNTLRESYQKLLSSNILLSPGLKKQYEIKLAELDGIDYNIVQRENEIAQQEAEKKEKELQKSLQKEQPLQKNGPVKKEPNREHIKHHIEHLILSGKAPQEIEINLMKEFVLSEEEINKLVEEQIDEFEQDYSLEDWIGEFIHIKKNILEVIASDSFENLAATNKKDLTLGKLNKKEIEKLRNVMDKGFKEGKGLKAISNDIKKIGLKDRFIEKDGKKILQISKDKRAYAIARTETVRLRAEGSLQAFESKNKNKVIFTLVSQKPCPQCESLDGNEYLINEAHGIIPVHGRCRCKWEAK